MFKTRFLVPVRDNSGQPFPTRDWEALEQRLAGLAPGFSKQPNIEGYWKAPDGTVYRDVSTAFDVALTSLTSIPGRLAVVRFARERFRQEAIYCELAGIVEII